MHYIIIAVMVEYRQCVLKYVHKRGCCKTRSGNWTRRCKVTDKTEKHGQQICPVSMGDRQRLKIWPERYGAADMVRQV